jgi:aminocarboxymuconate-semialdehyde decarboxylase
VIAIADRLTKKPTDYLKNMYFDAISYNPVALQSLVNLVGAERIMFGTDNPFFPPTKVDDIYTAQWPSTVKVHECIQGLSSDEHKHLILYKNATKLFNL